jgi:hypothetical protein
VGVKRMSGEENKGEVLKVILKICDKIDDNPKVREEAEMYQEKYGVLSEEELRRVITI